MDLFEVSINIIPTHKIIDVYSMAGVELMMGVLLNLSVSKVVGDHITKRPPSWLIQGIIYQVYSPASLPFVRGSGFSWGTAFLFLLPFATLEGEAPFD